MSKDSKAITTICKRDPEVVRLVLGLDSGLKKKASVPRMFDERTKEEREGPAASPLVGADAALRRLRKTVDDDDLVDFIEAEEAWLSAVSAAASAAYASGVADFGAIVSTTQNSQDSALLKDSKDAVIRARDALRLLVAIVDKPR